MVLGALLALLGFVGVFSGESSGASALMIGVVIVGVGGVAHIIAVYGRSFAKLKPGAEATQGNHDGAG